MKKFSLVNTKKWLTRHKVWSIVILIGIVALGYGGFKYVRAKTVSTTYVLSAATKDIFTNTITGSGDIEASDELAVTAKASGTLTSIKVSEGQTVTKGTLLAQIDCPDLYANLQNAQINLAKLEQSDPLSSLQTQNNLTSAQETATKAQTDLTEVYKDGYDAVSNASLGIPSIITNLNNVFYSSTGYLSDQKLYGPTDTAKNYVQIAAIDYDKAKNQYDLVFRQYKTLTRDSNPNDVSGLINSTYDTLVILERSIKEAKNATDYLAYNQSTTDTSNGVTSTQTNLTTWLSQVDGYVQALETIKNTITNTQTNLNSANRSIQENQQSLQNGTSSLNMQSQQLSVEQAQRNYNNCFVTAPFNGVVAQISAKLSHPVNSGDTIATVITDGKIAKITLDEIDSTKVEAGQATDLTFDAIDGLNIKGTVSKVDNLGTVSSGVVSYTVTITLDTTDSRIKPGMSVNATITTESRPNVILVPNAAIKTGMGNRHYVEISNDQEAKNSKSKILTSSIAPKRQIVEVGSSNDTVTEITSGLNEGDLVVIKTTTSSTSTKTSTSLGSSSSKTSATTRGFTGGGAGMIIPRN
jgi:HlyD family secretion protein